MFEALPPHIALLGDTQETLIFERVIGREHNVIESKLLIEDMAKVSPERILMLGDFVSYGSSRSDWKNFDRLMTPVHHKSIPVEGILGNHDYWGGGDCLDHAYERFPKLKKSHWYVEEYHTLAFIFLDTNRNKLGQKKWDEQQKWLEENISRLDKDSDIRGIFVLGHHPPYTNSKVTPDDEDTKLAFTPAIYASEKTLGFISGHAHGYEHFEKENKHFIVSGGGGGPRVSYHMGKKQIHSDLYSGPVPRPFHYLLMTVEAKGVWITARGLGKDEKEASNFDRFFIEFKGNSSL